MVQLGGPGGSLIIGYIAKAHSIQFAWTVAAVVILVSSVAYVLLMTIKSAPTSAEQACP